MSRVSEILTDREMSFPDVAKRSGLSEARIREVAAGATVSLAEVRSIAHALRLPTASLLRKSESARSEVLFRKMRAKDGSAVAARVISEQVSELLDLIGSPHESLALQGLRASFALPAEGLSGLVRGVLGYDDLQPALELATRASSLLGIAVCYSRDPLIEGASVVADRTSFAFIAPRSFRPRALFSLAHEIGHLIAHHIEAEEGPILDTAEDIDQVREPRNALERYADQFASSLLLPRHGVLRSLTSIRREIGNERGPMGDIEIVYLARYYGVSFEVAARRCESMDLIPKGSAIGLYQAVGDDHLNPERRADEIGLPARVDIELPTSAWLIEIAREKITRGELSIGKAAEILNSSKSAILAFRASRA